MPHNQRLRTQCGQRRCSVRCILLRGQHLVLRGTSQLIARSGLLSPLLTELHQFLGRRDLLVQSRRIDHRRHNVGRQGPPGRLELERLLVNLAGQGAVGQKGRAKEIEGVGGLDLGRKHVINESLLFRQNGNTEGTLP